MTKKGYKQNAKHKKKIALAKQALRDLPQTFDLSSPVTPDELKAAWPDELK